MPNLARKLIRWQIVLLLLLSLCAAPLASDATPALSFHGKSAALLDLKTGRVLYQSHAATRLPEASTTKIMTALVAINSGKLSQKITVPREAPLVEGSKIYLSAGQTYTLDQMLYALLLSSANDAAITIASGLGPGTSKFVDKMNQEARKLGLSNTRYANPHGLSVPGHYTSAMDLAKLTRIAMQNPVFRKIVSTKKAEIPWPEKKTVRVLYNHNKLLTQYDGAIGVKTGYTTTAGQCLVGAACQGSRSVVAVELGNKTAYVWSDMHKLLDFGLAKASGVTKKPAKSTEKA